MKNLIKILFGVLLGAFVCIGWDLVKGPSRFVGKWQGTAYGETPTVWEFRADGTLAETFGGGVSNGALRWKEIGKNKAATTDGKHVFSRDGDKLQRSERCRWTRVSRSALKEFAEAGFTNSLWQSNDGWKSTFIFTPNGSIWEWSNVNYGRRNYEFMTIKGRTVNATANVFVMTGSDKILRHNHNEVLTRMKMPPSPPIAGVVWRMGPHKVVFRENGEWERYGEGWASGKGVWRNLGGGFYGVVPTSGHDTRHGSLMFKISENGDALEMRWGEANARNIWHLEGPEPKKR
ncbi:MAG: hypothetical protein LBR07_08180 [Puniceicoccales bacterium]|jgi:hypothetical protein|nr:hypothetical protein [Puniceicoccales bacterium]